MTILILGATGRTGKQLTKLALERGYRVNVLVRDKQKLSIKHNNLNVMEGSVLEPDDLRMAMKGTEAILSTLNISRTNDFPWSALRTPRDFLSNVMKKITLLAPECGIRRIIFTSAWGVGETRRDIPGWFRWFIEHSNILYPYEDHARQEDLISTTDLEWTAIRASGLTNFKNDKQTMVSFNNTPKPSIIISRRAVAAFMLDILEQGLYVRQKPVISQRTIW